MNTKAEFVRLTSPSTNLMTLDGNLFRIPNSTVYEAVILNYTRNPERRFEFDLGVDAADDQMAAMTTGLDAIRAPEYVTDEPGPNAIIKSVGDTNIVISFMGWMDQTKSDVWKMRSLAIKVAKDAIEQGGFTLPEPLYRVRLEDRGGLLARPHIGSDGQAARIAPAYKKENAAANTPGDAVLGVSSDTHIEEIVSDERSQSGDTDLLDSATPVE